MKNCDHTVGFVERDYEFSGTPFEAIQLSDLTIGLLKDIKNGYQETEFTSFNFCPKCGEKINKQVQEKKDALIKKEKEERKSKEDKKQALLDLKNKKIEKFLNSFKDMDQEKVYTLTAKSKYKDMIFTGQPKYIAKNLIANERHFPIGDLAMNVISYRTIPTKKEILEKLKNCGIKLKVTELKGIKSADYKFILNDKEYTFNGSDEDGKLYLTIWAGKKGNSQRFHLTTEEFIEKLNLNKRNFIETCKN